MRSIFLFAAALFFLKKEAAAQVILSADFKNKLLKSGLEFLEPVENLWATQLPLANEFQPFDVVFVSKDDSVEVRYFVPTTVGTENPQIELSRAVWSAGTNEEIDVVMYEKWPDSVALARFGADWAAQAWFTPKQEWAGGWQAARVVVFQKKGRGLVLIFALFNRQNRWSNSVERTVRFRK